MGLFGLFYGAYVAGRWTKDTIRNANFEAEKHAREIQHIKSNKDADKQKAIEMKRTIYPYTFQIGYEKTTRLYDVETDREILIVSQYDRLEGCHGTCPQCTKEMIIDWETGKVLRQSDKSIYEDILYSKYKIKDGESEKYLLEEQKYFEEKKKEINQWVDENSWLLQKDAIGFYKEMGIRLEWKFVGGDMFATTSVQNAYKVFYDESELEYKRYRYEPKYKCDLKNIYK